VALMSIRSVLVIGGSGFIGQHVVRRLAARGMQVRVPTRARERAKQLILLPTVEVLDADVHDPGVLARLVAPVDAVINLVGILHGDFQRAHVELPRAVLVACRAAGVRRYVHMSALKAGADGPSAYLRSKGQAEALVRTAQSEGLQTTIFRPSVVFGREDRFLNLFVQLARIAPALAVASPNARFQPVHVDDVAQAIAGCLDDPRTFGQAYELCGPKVYCLRELVQYACRTAGLNRPVIGLGPALSRLQARVLELLPGKLMTRDNLLSMQLDNVCDCAFPEVLGFAPTALEAVVPTYIAGVTPRSRYRWFRFRARR
jgi:NADH dehydrogenase